ncbi:sulfite exporter TauE/SafE family protein [Pulveribacter suum]|uniref:Sulfite exporter TauE/SafE family protein n=1 Tax=Pulveribacter suum TaxID=2116657 RepID=A0A2P1NKY7_9BURK|nr:sulfite exporter TauE/SafE family protein [Pulveribacter suum]AVP57729.1 sulfite exporter TauE/SafE family protein [Pulveribacter suum]
MFLSLATTVFLMGLMGGTHCLAMCAAPCGALTGAGRAQDGAVPVHWAPRRPAVARTAAFHLGRLTGYAAAGAVVALAMEQLAWLGQHSTLLKPVWTLTHVLVIAWGLMMVLQARQPAWIEQAGRAAWRRIQPLVARPGGLFMTGMAWALLPCGLLYTALLTAALSGSAARGALCMLLFGLASGAWLVGGPLAWQWLRQRFDAVEGSWGSRLAGCILCLLGGAALWMEVVHNQPAPWCIT